MFTLQFLYFSIFFGFFKICFTIPILYHTILSRICHGLQMSLTSQHTMWLEPRPKWSSASDDSWPDVFDDVGHLICWRHIFWYNSSIAGRWLVNEQIISIIASCECKVFRFFKQLCFWQIELLVCSFVDISVLMQNY